MHAISRLLLAATLLSTLPAARPQAPPPVIPPLHATLLTGPAVDLPAGLHGKPAILVMGFSQDSRDQVAAWGLRLAREYAASPAVAFYELAQLQSVPRLLRGLVTRKVIASVPERAHAHFLVLADHEPEWKQTVAFSAPNEAYILLIDSSGTVRARAHGPLNDAAWDQLQRQTEALLATRP